MPLQKNKKEEFEEEGGSLTTMVLEVQLLEKWASLLHKSRLKDLNLSGAETSEMR